ncbi:MAG: phospholipase [Polyangiaceae bacterium]|nr:phospholipase [Polyangiaceae bacterium]
MSERNVRLRLVWGKDHYDDVIRALRDARVSIWISTASLKDVHVEASVGTRARARGRFASLMEELGDLAGRGVEVRILHAGPPSRPLRARLQASSKARTTELRRCIRVHMKMIAIDGRLLYLGSANFTGAGLGAKSEGKRNFEAGILTSDDVLLDRMQGEFDSIWSGAACKSCRLRGECPKPLDTPSLPPHAVRGVGGRNSGVNLPSGAAVPSEQPASAGAGYRRTESAAPAKAAAASRSRGAARAGRRGT